LGLVAITKAQPTRTVTEILMFLRIDRLQVELSQPRKADQRSAADLQELLGGKFGEIPGLNNDVFQNVNFHNKGRPQPFYSHVAWIIALESGPVELRTQPPIHRHNALECYITRLPRPRVSQRPPQSE
jgi:Manganese containing catalase